MTISVVLQVSMLAPIKKIGPQNMDLQNIISKFAVIYILDVWLSVGKPLVIDQKAIKNRLVERAD